MTIMEDMAVHLERGDSASLKEMIKTALAQNIGADKILNESLIKGMETLGKKFKKNEIFIPEVLIAARAMKAGLDILRPFLTDKENGFKVKIVIGTVK